MVISEVAYNSKIGSDNDKSDIKLFAASLAEDVEITEKKWLKVINEENVCPILVYENNNIVGEIQTRVIDNIGWIESPRIHPLGRKKEIVDILVNTSLNWLKKNNISKIRTMVEADNLLVRQKFESLNFSPSYLAIKPSIKIDHTVTLTNDSDYFAQVIGEKHYNKFENIVNRYFYGNLVVDGNFIPLSQKIFTKLISERRIFTTAEKNTYLVLSRDKLPYELSACIISSTFDGYFLGAKALIDFTSQEIASYASCYTPAKRRSVKALINAGFSWQQPYSLIIYEKSKIDIL